MLTVIGCITQQHDPRLVVLAALICVMACFTAVNMLSRCDASRLHMRRCWLAGAGVAFGGGVWATHFVAMLAFRPELSVSFRLVPTALSALLAILGSVVAFAELMGPARRLVAVGAASVLLCGTVGTMHYVGTAAMQLPAIVTLDPRFVVASLLGGWLPMAAALWGLERLRGVGWRLLAAVLLALGIVVLHFVGMAGTEITPFAAAPQDGIVLASPLLAVGVAAVTAMVLVLSLSGSLIDEQFAARVAREARRLRQLANVTSQGIVIQAGGVVLDLNDAACAMLGRGAAQVIGQRMAEFQPPQEREAERLWRGEARESQLLLPDGSLRLVELTARAIEHDGRPAVAVAMRDLTEAKRAEARIQHLANHDVLTDLPNRVLFNARLIQELELAERRGTRLAVLCLDLDRFKPVNDLLGHQHGDRLLALVAERLRETCRAGDTIARVGGDEFSIVQPDDEQPHAAAALARRLVEVLGEPFAVGGQAVEIGASIGIAWFPEDGPTAGRLLMNADTALYRAKQDGRGVFRCYEAAMDQRGQKRRLLEQELRGALSGNQLELHYQPFVDAMTREVLGCEALLRWNHPERGVIPPGEFIPLAESSGLILRIGRWVLETACAEAAGWPSDKLVAVNLSPVQFRQADLAVMVADILRATGLPARRLELEITEGVLIDAPERALQLLHELKAQGVHLALDDFGTGYSSLSYLRRFPFDKLKIDRSFVKDLDGTADARAIVDAIIALAHSLRMTVIAEGVETRLQRELLFERGCNQLQGFLLGRPGPAAALPWHQARLVPMLQAG